MRALIALGGNALLRRGEAMTAENQRRNVRRAAEGLGPLLREHRIVLTHGNGPQVGLLALQNAAYGSNDPLDLLGAESEGMIGYLIEQELEDVLPPGWPLATLLTQTVVDRDDPAFQAPTKPVGPVYDRAAAEKLAAERGWRIAPDGDGFRRVVPSPAPRRIVEQKAIDLLVKSEVTVICAGGGGIPVVEMPDGRLVGVEAVIDKDRTSAALALALGMDMFVMLTDVDGVYDGWRTPQARRLVEAPPDTADPALDPAALPAGSIGPKVEAARHFAKGGGTAVIGRLEDVGDILAGTKGSRFTARAKEARWTPCSLAPPA